MGDSVTLQELQSAAMAFSIERDWGQFHSPKNLAMALAGEVGELVEIFQWLPAEESAVVMPSSRARNVQDEIAVAARQATRRYAG